MKLPKDPTKRTKRLELRTFRVSDYGVWKEYKLRTQRAKNRWDRIIKKPSDASLSAFRKFFKKLRSDERRDFTYTFGVFLRDSGELIGFIAIMEVYRSLSHSAYLGYRIDSAFWGNGYGKEAVKAALKLGFCDLKLHRLEAGIEPQNERSIALAKSLGMRFEGRKKRAVFFAENGATF